MINRTWDLGFNSLICVVDIDTKTQFYDHLPIIARKPYNHTPNDGMYYVMHFETICLGAKFKWCSNSRMND